MNVTTTTDGFANASASVQNSMGSAQGLAGIVVGVVLVAVVVVYAASAAERYERLYQALQAFGKSLELAMWGVVSVAVVGVVVAPIYYLSTLQSETQAQVGKYAVVAIVAYGILVGTGYVGRWVAAQLAEHHDRVTPDAKPGGE